MAKNLCLASYLKSHTPYDCHLRYISVEWWCLQMFFYIFKTLIFWVVSGVKGKKNGPKWQIILSVALHVSGTIHHMIFINGTHGENDKSSDFFTIFSKFGFFELLGGSKSTKWPIMAKNSVMSYISGTIHHIIFIYGTQV